MVKKANHTTRFYILAHIHMYHEYHIYFEIYDMMYSKVLNIVRHHGSNYQILRSYRMGAFRIG